MIWTIILILDLILTVFFSPMFCNDKCNTGLNIFVHLLVFIVCLIILILLTVIFYALMSLTFNKNKEYENVRFRRFIFNIGVTFIVELLNVQIKYNGTNKLPKDKKYLLVLNHKGLFDAVTLAHYFKKEKLSMISKPENFNIPVIGPFMHGMGHLSLDRENNRNALKTILKAINLIKEDKYIVGVCPEGTRNKEVGLLPFKSGCFKIATKAECPIAVCTIKNSEKVFKNFPFKKTVIEFNVVDIISYEEIKDLSTHEIGFKVRRKMIEDLNINETIEQSKSMIE